MNMTLMFLEQAMLMPLFIIVNKQVVAHIALGKTGVGVKFSDEMLRVFRSGIPCKQVYDMQDQCRCDIRTCKNNRHCSLLWKGIECLKLAALLRHS
jgi:hypothetical protein